LKPLVELLSSASSVDSPVLVDSLVSGLAAYLASLFHSEAGIQLA